jgi:hypothetical protein
MKMVRLLIVVGMLGCFGSSAFGVQGLEKRCFSLGIGLQPTAMPPGINRNENHGKTGMNLCVSTRRLSPQTDIRFQKGSFVATITDSMGREIANYQFTHRSELGEPGMSRHFMFANEPEAFDGTFQKARPGHFFLEFELLEETSDPWRTGVRGNEVLWGYVRLGKSSVEVPNVQFYAVEKDFK